ncbi:MAG TPA: hypothetical protein VFB78_02600 [Acidimicrobiales bacterium]|nr:hypothetical protein [Acidimicrobiales bacterium]
MAQLLRDNAADDRVAADVEHLAAAYNAESVAAANEQTAQARVDDLSLLVSAYADGAGTGAPLLGRLTSHTRRYRTLYVIAALVAGVLLFKGPLPVPVTEGEDTSALLPTGDRAAAVDGVPTPSASELAATGPLDLALPDTATSFEEPSARSDAAVLRAPVAAAALRIAQSGYASTFAGTPIDQAPPGDGLPVEALAGSATKLSFLRLGGGGRMLRLRMLTDPSASLNDAAARVQVCHITSSGWAAKRAMTTSEAPKYNANDCIEGARDASGVWTFRFVLDDPLDRNGWAVVPITTDNGTFRITFAPAAA